jgi:hypothetical protein
MTSPMKMALLSTFSNGGPRTVIWGCGVVTEAERKPEVENDFNCYRG